MKYRSRSAGQGACLKGMSRTITMQAFTLAAMMIAEKTNFHMKSVGHEIWVKVSGSRCVLEGYVKDNYYARFETRSNH